MKEIKGVISLTNEKRSITCCDNLQDILINGTSLFDQLDEYFNLDNTTFYHGEGEEKEMSVQYLISDQPFNDSFNNESARIINDTLYSEYISGCYSEWTCGYGGFDFMLRDKEHSICKELQSYPNQYLYLRIS